MNNTFAMHLRTNGKATVSNPRWDDVWELLPKHPGQAIKPMPGRPEGSKRIHSLHVHDNNHVFIGHGDGIVNDGRTMLVSLDPIEKSYTNHGIFDTESISTFRKFNGITYALSADPFGYESNDIPYFSYPPTAVGTVNAIHIFDMTERSGELWLCGSSLGTAGVSNATVWKSVDNAQSWERMFLPLSASEYSRAYRIVVNSKGYITVLVNTETWYSGAPWYVWDGKSWSKGEMPGKNPYPSFHQIPSRIPVPKSIKLSPLFTETDTHWIMGTDTGDIYILDKDRYE